VVEIGLSCTVGLNTVSGCISGNSVQVTTLFIEVRISVGNVGAGCILYSETIEDGCLIICTRVVTP
jgi:hypothetical protein